VTELCVSSTASSLAYRRDLELLVTIELRQSHRASCPPKDEGKPNHPLAADDSDFSLAPSANVQSVYRSSPDLITHMPIRRFSIGSS
jgi:hypothetical protein